MVPEYEKLCEESLELFQKHYNIGQLKLQLKSRASSHLYLDLCGIFDLINFSRSTWDCGASNLDAGIQVRDPKSLGPFKVQLGTRVALAAPLISGSLKTFTEGSWYRVDGTADFEAGDTRRFNVSGVVKLRNLIIGTRAEIDKMGQWAKQGWTAKYRFQDGLCLTANLVDYSKWPWTQNPWLAPPTSSITYTFGIYERLSRSVISRGIELCFGANHSRPELSFGCSKVLNRNSLIKAKLTSNGQIGLVGVFRFLSDRATVSICGLFDARDTRALFGCGFTLKE